ncbi:hypothetical protein [Snodgrassella communis]|jgi:hypothetical protein|uniref:hypothetical protein n=1 Tax=Snodgrassella communis TaxID=2946699 RepID=UPI00192B6B94|nr:hypothetical protein [Snodgrassella communis]
MHIYAFGSIYRGEVDLISDIDLLAIVNGRNHSFNPKNYSIYTYARIDELWEQENPCAWHLFLESRLIYLSDSSDYLHSLGKPDIYNSGLSDCKNFYEIFLSAKNSIEKSNLTEIFDLSSIFRAVRNFATCYTVM